MIYLLDTNICILLLATQAERLRARVRTCVEGDLAVSSVTFAEIAFGSRNGKMPPLKVLEAFIRDVPPVPFDTTAARQYAELPFRRGSFDRLIAAHALALDLTLVTNNERDFADIPDLRVENWTL
ncbi:type II toxin-antitoxin system VapC family toxin [Sphingomonas sp. PAMC 26617]|uniref:type II toxin-antitoxin system VapC family toxin n=1 Tax=Sphingomonas sp. PAMC 26617 TaxID=1112216 RepID=UPI00030399BF|nr:type II toxin-antitoxin system VapC family toxin [Sphingomonas sp. PAMC 26617]